MQSAVSKHGYLSLFILMLSLFFAPSSFALSNSDFDAMVQKAEERRVALAKTMEASTIFIFAESGDSSIEMGTGFIIKENYILTNAHVIDGAKKIFVAGKDFSPIQATLVKKLYNDVDDFALLKFNQPVNLPVLPFTLSLSRTDKVSAWGYPYLVTKFDQNLDKILSGSYGKLPPVVYTEGVVSAFVEADGGQAIIHSASVSPGNSGGPLINNQGQVVGINTWIAATESGEASINAALPSHAALKFLRSCNLEPSIAQSNGPILAMQDSTPARALNSNTPNSSGSSGFGQYSSFFGNAGNKAAPSLDNKTYPSEQAAAQLRGQAKALYPDALAGDADAQAYIGASYYLGDEAPELEDEAIYWLKQSAAQGNLTGISSLGALYVQSVPYKNISEGLKLLRQAVAQDAEYAHILAHFLLRGESLGVPHDAKGGFKAALQGAEADNIPAIGLLAYAYAMGFGVECDEAHALELAEIAAEEGDALAHAVLAYLYCIGGDIEENIELSLEYATAAAEADETMAYGVMALHYIIESTDLSPAEALEYASAGAEQADELSQFAMGILCLDENLSDEIDLSLSWAYLELAAQKNLSFAAELRDEIADVLPQQDLALGQQYIDLWRQDWGL